MIVVDAAALVDVVIDRPTKGWVVDELDGQDLLAPAHQLAEVVSAVARLVRAGRLDRGDADDALDEAGALHQELVTPTATHLHRALELQERVRVLDGLYIALAEDRQVPLLTTDRRLASSQLDIEVVAPEDVGSAGPDEF